MYTAIIPARKGSVRCPNKNTKPFAGTTLVNLAIECALDSIYIERIVLTTDNYDLKSVAEWYHIDFHYRQWGDGPMQAVVDEIKADDKVLLQPTSPLRTPEIVDKGIMLYIDSDKAPTYSVDRNNKPNGDVFVFKDQIYGDEDIMFVTEGIDIDTEEDWSATLRAYNRHL